MVSPGSNSMIFAGSTPPIVDSSSPAKILKELLDFFDCVLVEKKRKNNWNHCNARFE
ncbi:hypothetical protein AAA799E16_02087 [Marine Group I thaumarchaeote SCGC AAA799-E16]|uniref:Uncharacterized protein n=1 Tax=Marine Group I thaumarchaeote SCGC AAA799-E16 TaxID=1502292 RepID=A0A081S2X6_9ARCH|nr:hypothetical protein AAA799E16_02087 [Marine Group I thaumarchaeote SCGC AAA799-E16]